VTPSVVFDTVSKRFIKGEQHDTLRDSLPGLIRRILRRRRSAAPATRDFWALRDVSFAVEPGQALGIIGPNGAGKSTTLKILTRILRPTTGRSTVKGRVGALIEVAAGFHPDLTGRENIFLQGAVMGMKRPEISARFDEIVDFAGIGQFIDTPAKRYSSGMNARLGFSIAAHLHPDVLIIDEVLSVGDMAFQQKCYERMTEYKKRGAAIVLVSHNLQAVATLCDHAVYLAGQVVAAGRPSDVLDSYLRAVHSAQVPVRDDVSLSFTRLDSPSGCSADSYCDAIPGTELTLHLKGESAVPLDDVSFGFLIHRSTDQLPIFSGAVHRRELAVSASFGPEFSLAFTFRANLLRGHYYVSVHLLDNATQTYLVAPKQVAMLNIIEYRSLSGIVDIDLTSKLTDEPASIRCVG
jgi:lipopolysaccharide transport system ATP-binding protein